MTVPMEAVNTLRLHPVAALLLASAQAALLFSGRTECVEILPDGTVVAGTHAYVRSSQTKVIRIRVHMRQDLADEDPAVVAGVVVKDFLAGSKDPIAIGTAWAAFRQYCATAKRPHKGYGKTKYERRFGISPVERREQIVRDVFDLGDDQLRRLEKILPLPTELHDALRAGTVNLKALVAIAVQPKSVIAAAVTDVKAGTAPAEAVAQCLPAPRVLPRSQTVLARFLRAGEQAQADFAGRVDEIGYLRRNQRLVLEQIGALVDALRNLPTEDEVLRRINRVLSGVKVDPDDAP